MIINCYKGPYVAVPKPLVDEIIAAFGGGDIYHQLKECVEYEPDNHHNAALCPYCSPEAVRKKNLEAFEEEMNTPLISPQTRYEFAWLCYLEENEAVRADGDVLCLTCKRPYSRHIQPLKELNPTIRILCDGTPVKL